MKKKIFFVAGEQSGDLHASKIMQELNKSAINFEFKGIGGDRMIKEGLLPLYHVKDLGMMGISEVVTHFFSIKKIFNKTITEISEFNPDIILLIDFSEFNLRLGLKLKNISSKFKIFRFVAPQIWATRPGRLDKIVKAYDRLFCILPFEVNLYDNKPIKAEFVGHPLISQFKINMNKNDFFTKFKIPFNKKIIGVFPGSRIQEVNKHLKIINESIIEYNKKRDDLFFIVCKAKNINFKLNIHNTLIIDEGYNYEIMSYVNFLWCKSGTTSLQATLAETPSLVFYKVNFLTYFLAKLLLQVKYISLVNIINNKEVYPELIQGNFTYENIINTTEKYFNDDKLEIITKNILKSTKKLFGEKKSEEVISKIIFSELS